MLTKATRAGDFNRPEVSQAGAPIKALIIFPPARRSVRAMYTFHNDDEYASLGHKPPLGPLYVATYAKKNSPHEVRILDAALLDLDDEGIKRAVADFGPQVVGVTAWTDFWYDSWKCIQLIKEVSPSIHVTVGGPHVGIYPRETLEFSGCDSVIQGDGEVPFLWLLNGISNGSVPNDLPGLHLKDGPPKDCSREWYIHPDLDELGWPDRTMLPYREYRSLLADNEFVTTMITSRGCPYKCTFCKLSFQKVLSRSAENIIAEFEEIARLGIKEVEVYDDTFTWSKKRLIEICKGLAERDLGITWAIRDRVSSATPETVEWLSKAGCRRIHYGVESGSNKTLRTIKKAITAEQAVDAIRLAKNHGIEVLTYFMIGLPGETEQDVRETIAFATMLDPDFTTFSVTVPYAGTEMYEEGLKLGVIRDDFWKAYAKNPEPNFVIPCFYEEHLGKEDLLRLRNEATRNFYFRPRYILRQIRRVKTMEEFGRKARMAFGLFRLAVLRRGRKVYQGPSSGRFADNLANPLSVRS